MFGGLAMKNLFVLVVTSLVLVSQAWAISESNYAEDMATKVMPFYATGVKGTFTGKDGVPIAYIKFENPQEVGAIVITTGRTETYALYAEPIYDLAQKGYSIYIYDHRGQGFSGRMLANPQIGYVDHFDDYVEDLKTFVDTVVNATPHNRRYLLSHSMGGAVAAKYGLLYPQDFNAYAMNSPMIRINPSPYPYLVAQLIVDFNFLCGKANDFSNGQKPFNNPLETFEKNIVTTSVLRWTTRHNVFMENPEATLGGASNRWVKEGFTVGKYLMAHAIEFQPRTLILQAGADKVVEIKEEEEFCKLAQHCEITPVYAGAFHEMLRERDEVRDDVYARIEKFFSED
jgi:lysophospholipase